MRKGIKLTFCRKGHSISVVGRDAHGACKECRKEKRKREYIPNPRIKKQFCVSGHDTFICGRSTQGYCRNCKTIGHQNKLDKDLNYKLICNLRTRLNQAIKGNEKVGSAIQDLGCPIDFLKQYIETKFYSNMTWGNWGKVWQLDHIKELHTFDLTDREQFLEACHYTNLQPLTIEDHCQKTSAAITQRVLKD